MGFVSGSLGGSSQGMGCTQLFFFAGCVQIGLETYTVERGLETMLFLILKFNILASIRTLGDQDRQPMTHKRAHVTFQPRGGGKLLQSSVMLLFILYPHREGGRLHCALLWLAFHQCCTDATYCSLRNSVACPPYCQVLEHSRIQFLN